MYLTKESLPDVAENLSSDKTKALFTVWYKWTLSMPYLLGQSRVHLDKKYEPVDNRIEQCCVAHIVHSCHQY